MRFFNFLDLLARKDLLFFVIFLSRQLVNWVFLFFAVLLGMELSEEFFLFFVVLLNSR